MKVYEKVRAYIQEHGIKQIAVAERAGIPNNTFNAILNGKRTLYADDLGAICLALNVSPEVFIDVCSTENTPSFKKENEKMITKAKGPTEKTGLNVALAIENLSARPEELEEYAWIMSTVNGVDVSTDEEFQRRYNYFYKVRRNKAQKKVYYDLFEACKQKEDVDFSYIIRTLYEKTGWVEASFSSKMLATLKPDMPIWDSIVLANLGLKASTSDDKAKRLASSESLYNSIVKWYQDYLPTEKAQEAIAAFDAAFPEYADFSATKKIDFLLWAVG